MHLLRPAGTPEHPAQSGAHPREWLCEFAGTALVLMIGLSAVCFDFGSASPLRALPMSPRLLITGLIFAGGGSLIAISPLGRLSGAHLNPVVTLVFWTQRKVHPHDLAGYIVAQMLGALAGTAAVALLWGAQARSVNFGTTSPGNGLSDDGAVLVEAAITTVLLLTILLMTSSPKTARWTPLLLWGLIATLVWQVAPFTGTSMNPARSFGPALLAPKTTPYWVYVIGPLLGGACAAGVFALIRPAEVLTTKLFHDPKYPSTMATRLRIAGRSPLR